jgi:hypothetical protein
MVPTTAAADADVARRSIAGNARGSAHARVGRRRFPVPAIVVATIAIGALVASALLSW